MNFRKYIIFKNVFFIIYIKIVLDFKIFIYIIYSIILISIKNNN
jgi:hypothetical protein